MKILKEITQWEDNTPNHIYWVNDGGKVVAYQPDCGETVITFKKPMFFDRKYRKFQTLRSE